jgi:tripartite-type tricarboxylate transporter receptor subunit TctC
MVASGDLRLLMLPTMSGARSAPDVPTLAEHGYAWDFNAPFGLAEPKHGSGRRQEAARCLQEKA